MATHSSILAWRIPWTEEPGGLRSMESQRVRQDLATITYIMTLCGGHRRLEPEWLSFWQNIGSPVNFLFQECNKFTYDFAEEIRRQSFGALTPGYDLMARLRYIFIYIYKISSVQSLSRVRLCDPMNHSIPGLPVHHQLPELAQTHVRWVGDAIQPSPLLSPSPPAFNLSQHQGLFQWVSSLHQVAKVLEFQL